MSATEAGLKPLHHRVQRILRDSPFFPFVTVVANEFVYQDRHIPSLVEKRIPMDLARGEDLEALFKSIESPSAFDKACTNALFASVRTVTHTLTAAQDGVFTIDATGGFVPETLDEVRERFASGGVEGRIALGLSNEEMRALSMFDEPQSDFEVLRLNSLETERCERSCFALAEGGLCVSYTWDVDARQSELICRIGAARLLGDRIQKIRTTATS